MNPSQVPHPIVLALAFSLLLGGCASTNKMNSTLPEEKKMSQDSTSQKLSSDQDKSHAPGSHTEATAGSHVEWSYNGLTGPNLWGDLDPSFQACKTGDNQSPIDLKWARPNQQRPIEINYKTSPLKVIDNGHTIQVNVDPGSVLKVNGNEYELLQLHFHAQSEHTLSGKHYPMEVHFVHKSHDGKAAVLGRMIEVGDKPHPFIKQIWEHLPSEKNKEMTIAGQTINLDLAIPKIKTYYNYSGSLTTPPCTEGVDWNVLNTPMKISHEQLAAFRSIYSNNSRPVQQINNRKPANF